MLHWKMHGDGFPAEGDCSRYRFQLYIFIVVNTLIGMKMSGVDPMYLVGLCLGKDGVHVGSFTRFCF